MKILLLIGLIFTNQFIANDFGSAWISLIRNNSRFNINFDFSNNSKDRLLALFNKIGNGSTFRLSFKDVRSQKTMYLKVKKDSVGSSRIVSTADGKEASVFQFNKNYEKQAFNLTTSSLALVSNQDMSLELVSDASKSAKNLWKIWGDDFSFAKIQSTDGGFVGRQTETKSLFLPKTPSNLLFQAFDVAKLAEVTSALGIINPQSVSPEQMGSLASVLEKNRKNSFFFNNEVGIYLNLKNPLVLTENSAQDQIQEKLKKTLAQVNKEAAGAYSSDGQPEAQTSRIFLQFGDQIKLISGLTGLEMVAEDSRVKLSSSGQPGMNQWIVKMPKDMANTCSSYGQMVKNGTSVKLQNVATKSFLTIANVNQNFQLLSTQMVNDPNTEFLITDSENKDYIVLGDKLSITNLATQVHLLSGVASAAKTGFEQSLVAFTAATKDEQKDPVKQKSQNKEEDRSKSKKIATVDSVAQKIADTGVFYISEVLRNISYLQSLENFSTGQVALQVPFDNMQAQEFELCPVELKSDNTLAPGATFNREVNVSEQEFQASGFGYYKIANFSDASFVKLPQMNSKGAAWLGSTFMPGQIACSFIARTNEPGVIEVVFGVNLSSDPFYKLEIGINGGKTVRFVRLSDGEILAQEPLLEGLNIFGKLLQVWVCFDKGFLICGFGQVGQNVLLCATDDKYLTEPVRIGFVSGKSELEVAEIKESEMVKFSLPEKLGSVESSVVLIDVPTLLVKQLRGSCYGMINFEINHDPNATFKADFYTSREDFDKQVKPNAVLEFKVSQLTDIMLKFSCQCVHRVKRLVSVRALECQLCNKKIMQSVMDNGSSVKQFFINFTQEEIILGYGDNQKPLAIFPNQLINKGCGFVAVSGSNATLTKTDFSEPIELSTVVRKKADSTIANSYDLVMVMPFLYKISQEGSVIRFYDLISNKTTYMGKATAKGTKYTFILAINENGLPDLTWLVAPEDRLKTGLMISSSALTGTSAALLQASTRFESTGDVHEKSEIPGLLATAASGAVAGVAFGLGASASAIKAQAVIGNDSTANVSVNADKKNNPTQPKITVKQSLVGVADDGKVDLKNIAKSEVSSEVLYQAQMVENEVQGSMIWQPTDREKFVSILSTYRTIIGMIDHPMTVKNPVTKNSIVSMLNALVFANNRFGDKLSATLFIETLSKAIDNPYLLSLGEQQSTARNWKSAVEKVILEQFKSSGSVYLPPLMNFPCKLMEFKPTNFVKVSFNLRTQSGATIYFGGKNAKGQNVWIGLTVSTNKLAIDYYQTRRYNLEQLTFKEEILEQVQENAFVILYDSGTIAVSKNTTGKNGQSELKPIFSWRDPFPMANISNVSVAGSTTSVQLDSIQIELSGQKSDQPKALSLANQVQRQKSIPEQEVEAQPKVFGQELEIEDAQANEPANGPIVAQVPKMLTIDQSLNALSDL